MYLDYIKRSHTGMVREVNQDFAGVFQIENGLLAIDCDGVGGNKAGDLASKMAVEIIHRNFLYYVNRNMPSRIYQSMLDANLEILRTAQSNLDYDKMATTADCLAIVGNKVYLGHAGDSRIYLLFDNVLYQLTKDHSLVQKLVDNGLISEEAAKRHPKKNIILNALGVKQDLIIDFHQFEIDINCSWKIMLCTDGVCGVLSHQEIDDILRYDYLEEIDRQIIWEVESRGAPDNFTYILISNQFLNY